MPRVGDETLRSFGAAPADPLVGSVVDGYRIDAVVGAGAMGIVYRGVHTVIGKPVAIKVLKPDYADDPEMVQRLVREARSVNAIRHPSIVDIFGFGTLGRTGQPYIVMDLLVGEPLDAFIVREAPCSLRTAAPILDELLSALAAAHAVGVIHRDLKPGNCFLEQVPDGNRRLKLLDFGLARQADRAGGSVRPTNPGTLLGTPAFMAPEQVMGQKVTPATDLYAVGGIAYQLLTGHIPHEAPTAIEVLTQKMKHDPMRPRQWNPRLDEDIDAWIMGLLERDVERREREAENARRTLRRLTEVRTMAAGTPAVGSSPVSGSRRAAGVVPRREWKDARTIVIDGSSRPAPEVSTDSHPSPWAGQALPSSAEESTMPQTQGPFGGFPAPASTPVRPTVVHSSLAPVALDSADGAPAAPTMLFVPAQPMVEPSALESATPVGPSPAQRRPGDETLRPSGPMVRAEESSAGPTRPVAPGPPRALILALVGTVSVLVGALIWLFRMMSS